MIWLIGNKGMLGSEVEILLKAGGYPYIASDREVDICNPAALNSFVSGKNIDWIINCSAYTAVDRAEDEPDLAFAINAEGVQNIAQLAGEKGARLVHVSTDYVFDGEKDGAYGEDDQTGPAGVYGKSKLAGEEHIRATLREHYIVRTAWLYGLRGANFVYTMLRLFGERDEVRVVNDQAGSPTYAADLAVAITSIIQGSMPFGIYHFTNEGKTTWYNFARAIRESAVRHGILDKNVLITPITTKDYPTKAKRPKNSYLSKGRIRKALKLEIRDWESALDAFMETYAKERKTS